MVIHPEVITASREFYVGASPLEASLYTYNDVPRMVGVPSSTAQWWMRGRVADGHKPVLRARPTEKRRGLSFLDVLELYAIKQLRQVHGVELDSIRRAVRYAERALGVERVLLREDLATFGRELFLTHLGDLVSLTRAGQVALRDVVEAYLRRIDWAEGIGPVRFYPKFPGIEHAPNLKPVSISPFIAFGRPTVTGYGVKTSVIAARIDAGESVDEVASDYGMDVGLVTSAVRYEYAA